MIQQISLLLAGKKTYGIGLLMIVLGILQGEDQMILEGIGFITMRAGISKMGADRKIDSGV